MYLTPTGSVRKNVKTRVIDNEKSKCDQNGFWPNRKHDIYTISKYHIVVYGILFGFVMFSYT